MSAPAAASVCLATLRITDDVQSVVNPRHGCQRLTSVTRNIAACVVRGVDQLAVTTPCDVGSATDEDP